MSWRCGGLSRMKDVIETKFNSWRTKLVQTKVPRRTWPFGKSSGMILTIWPFWTLDLLFVLFIRPPCSGGLVVVHVQAPFTTCTADIHIGSSETQVAHGKIKQRGRCFPTEKLTFCCPTSLRTSQWNIDIWFMIWNLFPFPITRKKLICNVHI